MYKKYFLFVSLGISLVLSRSSFAAPAYGTHMPEERKWIVGGEGSFIIDRNFDDNQGGTKGERYFITVSYGIFQWFSFDGKIGVGDVEWKRIGADNISYDTNFAGGYGFRIKGYENEKYGVKSVIGFQHISVHPNSKNQDGDKHEAIIDDWQGSIIFSKDIEKFVPYIGARYGTVDLIKKTNEHDRKRIKAEKNYGIIIGIDYWISDRTKVNLEGAFLDGEEVAFGMSYDF